MNKEEFLKQTEQYPDEMIVRIASHFKKYLIKHPEEGSSNVILFHNEFAANFRDDKEMTLGYARTELAKIAPHQELQEEGEDGYGSPDPIAEIFVSGKYIIVLSSSATRDIT